MKRAVLAGLLLAATPALAASALTVDAFEGRYTWAHRIRLDPKRTARAVDILEISKASATTVNVHVFVTADYGHECDFVGEGRVVDDVLIASRPTKDGQPVCRLSIQMGREGLGVEDAGDGCKMDTCGSRAHLGGTVFLRNSRQKLK